MPPDIHPFPTRRSSDLLELVGAARARDHPHRLAVGVDPLVEALEVVEVSREQVLDDVGGDLRDVADPRDRAGQQEHRDRKSTRLNSSHGYIAYAVFRLK